MEQVSVIIPAYNKSDLTIRTVNSVLAQTYQNIEIIVVDDGSTDDTREKLSSFGDKIRTIHKKNGGACSARNVGIQHANGEYIALLDCDDIYYPDKIKKSIDFLKRHPDKSVVFTAANFIDSDDKVISETAQSVPDDKEQLRNLLILSNIFCNSTIVARKSCFDKVGLFDETIFIPADWDMWIRLSEEFNIGYLNEKLTGYRIIDSYTNANLEVAVKEAVYTLQKTFERDANIPRKTQKHSLANVFSGYGLTYAAAKNYSKARKYLKKSIKNRPLKLNILVYCILAHISPRLLHRIILARNPKYKYSIKAIA